MLKEKLKKFGEYVLVTFPIWAPISVAVLDYNTSKHIDDYTIRQSNNSTSISCMVSHTIPILTTLIDYNNDGIIDKKTTQIAFPRKGLISMDKKVTEEDQTIYKGLLAKL